MSFSQVGQASGLGPSVLSRLENHPQANPTLQTLLRYAAAIGVELRIAVVNKTAKAAARPRPKPKARGRAA